VSIEIKINCKTGADDEIIGQLVRHLRGMDYQINVTASSPVQDRRIPAHVASAGIKTAFSATKRKQPLGENKRKVLAACAEEPENYFTLEEAASASGLEKMQVRSVALDAVKRHEMVQQTTSGVHRFRITDHGLARLEQSSSKNTQSPLRPMVAA
jgi:hypothetical protein